MLSLFNITSTNIMCGFNQICILTQIHRWMSLELLGWIFQRLIYMSNLIIFRVGLKMRFYFCTISDDELPIMNRELIQWIWNLPVRNVLLTCTEWLLAWLSQKKTCNKYCLSLGLQMTIIYKLMFILFKLLVEFFLTRGWPQNKVLTVDL